MEQRCRSTRQRRRLGVRSAAMGKGPRCVCAHRTGGTGDPGLGRSGNSGGYRVRVGTSEIRRTSGRPKREGAGSEESHERRGPEAGQS